MAGEGGSGGKGVPDNLLTVSWHDSAWIPVLSQAGHVQISQSAAKYKINSRIEWKLSFWKNIPVICIISCSINCFFILTNLMKA
jgi:hypothetical protein